MNYRQKVLKAVYPALMWYNKLTGKKTDIMETSEGVITLRSLHALTVHLNGGEEVNLGSFRGKKILIVNTASNCGYTGQYADLQQLYEKFQQCLVVIGFPANDFKEQEKGNDSEIAAFCKKNYGVTFPLTTKVDVKGNNMTPVYQYLTSKSVNGKLDAEIKWNFNKFLINENGEVEAFYGSKITPESPEIADWAKRKK